MKVGIQFGLREYYYLSVDSEFSVFWIVLRKSAIRLYGNIAKLEPKFYDSRVM